jgi:hypothetical protein
MTIQAGKADGWPQALDYNAAIQAPAICFRDPELREAVVERHPVTRMPKLWTGGFADVYRLRRNGEWIAVKCFKRSSTDVRERYAAISEVLEASRLPYFVDFRFLHDEMLVNGGRYPVVKMRWADGMPLHEYVRGRLTSPAELRMLAARLVEMVHALEANGLAHGDFQHGNILVGPDGLTLVDYDGMFVRAFEGEEAPELGLPNYQHPRRTAAHYGPGVDRFPLVVLCTGLFALAADPSLWARYNPVDTESFLFTRDDFLFGRESELVAHLRRVGDRWVDDWLELLLESCDAAPDAIALPAIPDAAAGDADRASSPWAAEAVDGGTRPMPWWLSLQAEPARTSGLVPVPPGPLSAAQAPARPVLSYDEVSLGPTFPFARASVGLAIFMLVLTGWLAPGSTMFIMAIFGVVVVVMRWQSVVRSFPPIRLVAAVAFMFLLWYLIPVHLFIAVVVTAVSVLADRYSKWKQSASSRYGMLTSRFADLVAMVQNLDTERTAVEREILVLNRAEVNEKTSSLLYLRRRAAESGSPAPTALPPELDRAITTRYQASRQTHTVALTALTRSMADLQREQREVGGELDTLHPPTFLDFLSARSGLGS